MLTLIFKDENCFIFYHDYHTFFVNRIQLQNRDVLKENDVIGYYTGEEYTYPILKKSLYGQYILDATKDN